VATVTVVNAERTLEIEATTVVDGEINAEGHLVLERRDGTPIDTGAISGMLMSTGSGYSKTDGFTYVGTEDPGAVPEGSVWLDPSDVAGPVASTTNKGLIEIATNSEIAAGTDATRAITPAGLASLPGTKVLPSNSITESTAASSYPQGVSLMNLTTGSGWSLGNGFGTVVTFMPLTDRTVQYFYVTAGGTSPSRAYVRTYHTSTGGGGWTAWSEIQATITLTPASFTQSTAFTSYPVGYSRLYYTSANSSAWDFNGKAGEVITYSDGTFAKQTWTRHGGGTATPTEMWIRTANTTNGWTNWRKAVFEDSVGRAPIVATGIATVPGGTTANQIVQFPVTFPAGRFPAEPVVHISVVSTGPGTVFTQASIGNLTNTGFSIYINRTNTSGSTVHWMAVLEQ
jgi:hypothetical protein